VVSFFLPFVDLNLLFYYHLARFLNLAVTQKVKYNSIWISTLDILTIIKNVFFEERRINMDDLSTIFLD